MASDAQVAVNSVAQWNSTAIDDVTNIAFDRNAAEKSYASSSTAGKIRRKTGHKDQSGTFAVLVPATPTGTEDVLPFVEGDESTLTLKSSSGQTLFNDNAVILNIGYSVPIEGGDLIRATVSWGRNPTS